MSEHLPRHMLERLAVDDPRDAVAEDLRAHLAACARCARRMQTLERARAEYASVRPAARFAAAVMAQAVARPQASRWHKLRWPAAGAVIAAAALFELVVQPARAPSDAAAIRYKGAPAELQVYVRHGAQTRVLRAGEALSEGDQLAFSYSLTRPQHLLLLGIDDAGAITHYFPEPSLAPVAVLPAGVAHQLPVGIELDARRGRERLVALFSTTPLDEARARDALSAALRAARTRGDDIAKLNDLDLPATQVSVWFEKP